MKKYVVGNWKMNKNNAETKEFLAEFHEFFKDYNNDYVVVGIAPSFTDLYLLKDHCDKLKVLSQNVHYEDHGAFTGEVSIPMLKELNINGAIIGHSERRQYNNENSDELYKKINALIKSNMLPLFCIGEDKQTYEAGKTIEFLTKEIVEVLDNVDINDLDKIVIAYEPIYSIGTGLSASLEDAEKVIQSIKDIIKNRYNKILPILYGGSVNDKNANEYLNSNIIDGVLVGGASLVPSKFISIIKSVK